MKNIFRHFFHDFSDFLVTGVFFEGVVCSKRVVTYHTHPVHEMTSELPQTSKIPQGEI